jgi:hypothetical protein
MKHFTAFIGTVAMLTIICIAGVLVAIGVVASECGDEDPYFYDNETILCLFTSSAALSLSSSLRLNALAAQCCCATHCSMASSSAVAFCSMQFGGGDSAVITPVLGQLVYVRTDLSYPCESSDVLYPFAGD